MIDGAKTRVGERRHTCTVIIAAVLTRCYGCHAPTTRTRGRPTPAPIVALVCRNATDSRGKGGVGVTSGPGRSRHLCPGDANGLRAGAAVCPGCHAHGIDRTAGATAQNGEPVERSHRLVSLKGEGQAIPQVPNSIATGFYRCCSGTALNGNARKRSLGKPINRYASIVQSASPAGSAAGCLQVVVSSTCRFSVDDS